MGRSSRNHQLSGATMGCCCCKLKSCCGKVSGEYVGQNCEDLNEICEELEAELKELHRLGREVKHLDLNFSDCSELTDISALTEFILKFNSPPLRMIKLKFNYCYKLANISPFIEAVSSMKGVQHLSLKFWHCRELKDISALTKGVVMMPNLSYLDLDFRECEQLQDISALAAAVSELHPDSTGAGSAGLTYLRLSFDEAGQLVVIKDDIFRR